MNSVRVKASNVFGRLAPASPHVGPPLPATLFISWPYSVQNNMPKPIKTIGHFYKDKVISGIQKTIRG
jgi:hypothetical protein